MKLLVRFILVATLGLIFSLSIQVLFPAIAQIPLYQQGQSNSGSALALVQSGKKHYDTEQFSAATQLLQRAAQIYQATGDVLKQAQTLSLKSLAQQQLGQWQEAETAINASLSMLATLPTGDELSQVRAQVLNSQGHLQLARGNAESALESWQDAETLYAQAGDPVGVIGSHMNQIQALQTLGLYRRAEKLLAQVEQQLYKQPDSRLKATGLQNLGNVRRQGGDLDDSRKILQLGLAIAQRVRSPQEESRALLSLGNTEIALARRAADIKDRQNAQQYIQKALERYQAAAAIATSPIAKIQAQLNQLSLLIETDRSTSAQVLLPSISEVLNQLPASRASIYARVNFAQTLMKMSFVIGKGQRTNDKKQIINSIAQILDTAVRQARSLADKRTESYALGTFGELYEKTEDWTNAKRFTQSALEIAQAINTPDIAYQWQWQMGRILQAQAAKKLHSRDADAEAIAYYTQAFNTLNELRSDLVALNPEVQFSFRESVEPVYRQLVDLLLRSPKPSKDNLIQARNAIEALQLAELDNFFRDACAKPKEVNIDDLDRTAAVIYPIILEDRLEVILRLPSSDNLRHYANSGVSESQVNEAVEQLRQSLRKRSTSLSQIKTESQQLYGWLIEPFAADLESDVEREQSQIKTLVFVLDGALQNVPMAALYDGQRYLVERYAVTVASSLQLLNPKPLLRKPLSALIAGATNAPSFQKEGFAPIDNVAVELSGIRKKVNRSRTMEDRAFLKKNIQSQLKKASFNIVHLATHGKFSSNPDRTFILDWEERIKVKDLDNLLRSDEQTAVKPVELLVLSACETAMGDKRAALGLAGIAIRAGASSTLATLWQVNDASTAEFMIQFYQQLHNPQITKAEALRNAQLAFLIDSSGTDYNRPYHWAPFILVGNWL